MKQLIAVIFIALVLGGCEQQSGRNDLEDGIRFADGISFWTAPTILATEEGYFKRRNLDVTVARFSTGLAAKNAVMSDSADIGIVATTPIAASMLNNEEFKILGTYFASGNVLALAKTVPNSEENLDQPSSSGYQSLSDNQIYDDFASSQRRVGVVKSTISEIFFDRLVEKLDIPRDNVVKVALGPSTLAQSMVSGSVDYVVAWEPFLRRVAASLNQSESLATRWSGEDYVVRLHLITRPELLDNSEEVRLVQDFLRSIQDASDFMIAPSTDTQARILVENATNLPTGTLTSIWNVSGPGGNGLLKFGLHDVSDRAWREELKHSILEEMRWLSKNGVPEPDIEKWIPINIVGSLGD